MKPMTKILFKFFALCLILTLIVGCKEKEMKIDVNNESVAVAFSPKEKNLGLISKQDSCLEFHAFITNETEDTIIISDIRPSCGCITILDSPEIILPQSKSDIRIGITLTNIEGYFSKKIYAMTSDKEPFLMTIIGEVE